MRKSLTEMVGTLKTSVIEIANSSVDDRDQRLEKSIGEFQSALIAQVEGDQADAFEPLEKSINHVAVFANTLRDAHRAVTALITGQPRWMVEDSSSSATEKLPEHIAEELDRWVDSGVLVLRAMVNDLAELPEDEDDLERAEQLGNLTKIEAFDGTDLLVKSALPPVFHEYLSDPVLMLTDYADMARSYTNSALALADPLMKADVLPPEVIDAYPELFDAPLSKANEDETVGTGGDPDGAYDPGSDQDTNPDLTDDMQQNPLEMIAKMGGVIMVLAQAQLQLQAQAAGQIGDGGDEQEGDEGDDAGTDPDQDETDSPAVGAASGMPDDTKKRPGMPLRRAAPADPDPLHKGAENDAAVAELRKRAADQDAELQKLRETVSRLQQAPAPAKGAVFQLSKGEDSGVQAADATSEIERITEIAKQDGDRGARELVKLVHAGGGTPMIPPR